MSDLPTATYHVYDARNAGMPPGRETYGIGVIVVGAPRSVVLECTNGSLNQ